MDDSQLNRWRLNPQGTIASFHYLLQSRFWHKKFEDTELVALVEGSWSNSGRGGIGGILKSKQKGTLLIISGPSSGSSCLEIELAAILTIWNQWKNSIWQASSLTICMDSKIMVNDFEVFLVNKSASEIFGGPLALPNHSGLKISHISRELNGEAHNLAKGGRSRSTLFIQLMDLTP